MKLGHANGTREIVSLSGVSPLASSPSTGTAASIGQGEGQHARHTRRPTSTRDAARLRF